MTVPGKLAIGGFLAAAALTAALTFWVAADLKRRGMSYEQIAARAEPALPELPAFPLETMEPAVRLQFEQALARVEAAPRDPEANGTLGALYHAYGFHALAERCYRRAAILDPATLRWRYRAGVALYEQGDWAAAIADFDAAAARRPWPEALLYGAESNRRLGRLDEAGEGYRAVLEHDPDNARALCGLGRVELRAGDPAAAAAFLRRALAAAPEYGPARYALGQALRELGRTAGARSQLELAEQQRDAEPPIDPELQRELAALRTGAIDALHRGIDLAQAGRYAEALPLLEEAVRAAPDLAEAHSQLGAVYLAMGTDGRALEHLRRAIDLDAGFADAHYNLGLRAHRADDYAAAVEHFRRAVAVRPDHFEAHLGLGTDLDRLGEADAALEHLREARALRPEDPRARKRLAAGLLDRGARAEALDVLRGAVQRSPADASVADRLAWALAVCPGGDPAEALAIAEAVCRRTDNREPRALDTRAAALAALGRFGEAAGTAEAARSLAAAEGDAELAAAIAGRIARYRAGEAVRLAPR